MRGLDWLRGRGGGVDWPRVLLVALLGVVLCAIGVAAATSSASFGPYNPGWDGSSDLREGIASTPGVDDELVRETAAYEGFDPENTVSFVVAPEEPYTGTDAERLRTFVESGGTLVVLGNFDDDANTVLETLGASARLDGGLLRDERNHFQGPPMPIADRVEPHELTDGVSQLTLNYATAVEPGEATVLVSTSDLAYLGDEETDLSTVEDLESYPVATVENRSEGSIVTVGDPSITINAMLAEPDNAAFVTGLYDGADHVVVDVSHVGEVPPLAAATLSLRASPALQVLLGLGAITVVGALSTRGLGVDRLRRTRSGRARELERSLSAGDPTADRAAYLRERHPEWDESRIERVTAALERTESGRDEHDQ